VAIDHVGHGLSSHIPHESMYVFSQYLFHVRSIYEELGWSSSNLMGHSMGGIISTLFTATFPEYVSKLVLIEGFSPMTSKASDTVRLLRKSLEEEYNSRKSNSYANHREYADLDEAVQSRMDVVNHYPGKQWISRSAAESIVRRQVGYLNENRLLTRVVYIFLCIS